MCPCTVGRVNNNYERIASCATSPGVSAHKKTGMVLHVAVWCHSPGSIDIYVFIYVYIHVCLPVYKYIYMHNYTNPGYGLSLVDTLWNAGSYRQPLEQEGNPMT